MKFSPILRKVWSTGNVHGKAREMWHELRCGSSHSKEEWGLDQREPVFTLFRSNIASFDSLLQERSPAAAGKGRSVFTYFCLRLVWIKVKKKSKICLTLLLFFFPVAFQSSEKQETYYKAWARMVVTRSTAGVLQCKSNLHLKYMHVGEKKKEI